MISKQLEKIDEADLDNLVTNSVAEGKTIEYKRVLPSNSDGDKKEFLADVSSFANTVGGDLICGVDEKQGAPTGIFGLSISDPDLEVRRLDSVINDGLEPRVRFTIRSIQRSGKPPVLIVRTERSWIGPHRVTFKGHDKFYARNSAGKYPMDVSELRSAFTFSTSVTERIRQFREDRLNKLQNNRTPVTLVAGPSRTILHCIPLESFSRIVQSDVSRLLQQTPRVPPIITGTGWATRINLDGFVTHSGSSTGSMSYTQLFRNGAIEAVEAYWLNVTGRGDTRTIPHVTVEKEVLEYLKRLFELQKQLGIIPPIVVALTLTRTRGLTILRDPYQGDPGHPIEEDNLVLPETLEE
jgi:hypothetical protein